ncbi:MAG: lambda-exonuclease family protein, partial [Cetobacterium sp.]
EWSGEEVPNEYYAQVQLYLAVTGLKFAYIACLVGGNDYKEFYIQRNNEECEYIINHCEWWWKEYVETQVPPPPSGDNAYTEYQKKKIELLNDVSVEIEEDETVQSYEEIIEKIDELEKEKKRIQQLWIDKMIESGASKAIIGSHKITTINQQRETFDKKKFKENIENYSEYFTVKETKFFKVN